MKMNSKVDHEYLGLGLEYRNKPKKNWLRFLSFKFLFAYLILLFLLSPFLYPSVTDKVVTPRGWVFLLLPVYILYLKIFWGVCKFLFAPAKSKTVLKWEPQEHTLATGYAAYVLLGVIISMVGVVVASVFGPIIYGVEILWTGDLPH